MIHKKSFYKYFFSLTFSLALQNLLTYGVNAVDNVMLGAYSQNALSGAAICNQIQFLLQMLVVGAGDGAVVLGSQYWGKHNYQPIPDLIGAALRFGVATAAVIFIIIYFFPAQVLGLLTNDNAIIAEGVKYFRIICYTYLIFTVTNILVASLRSIGIVKIGYITAGSTLCINICLNTCLIFGRFGFPRMGIQGAAVATLVSRSVELIIVICFLKWKENKLNLTLKKLVFIDTSYIKDYRKISLPVMLNQAQWGIAQMVQTGILGHLGAAAIAANAIATVVFQIISVVAYGAASASAITVGKTIGENNMGELHKLTNTLQVIFISIGVITGLIIFAVRSPVLLCYNISKNARTLSMQFMSILAVTSVGTSYQMAVDCGIIRGGGDTVFSMKMNAVSMWCIVVPFSALAAFVWKAVPAVVFFLLKWDQLYKVLPVILRLRSGKWIKKVTRKP